jgi:hypothetical protein
MLSSMFSKDTRRIWMRNNDSHHIYTHYDGFTQRRWIANARSPEVAEYIVGLHNEAVRQRRIDDGRVHAYPAGVLSVDPICVSGDLGRPIAFRSTEINGPICIECFTYIDNWWVANRT